MFGIPYEELAASESDPDARFTVTGNEKLSSLTALWETTADKGSSARAFKLQVRQTVARTRSERESALEP